MEPAPAAAPSRNGWCNPTDLPPDELHPGPMRNIDKYAKAWREVLGKSYCAYYPEGDDSARQYFLYDWDIGDHPEWTRSQFKNIQRDHIHIWPDPEDENNLCALPKWTWKGDSIEEINDKIVGKQGVTRGLLETKYGARGCSPPEGLQGSSKLPEEKQEKIDEALQQEEDYYRPMRGKFKSACATPLRVELTSMDPKALIKRAIDDGVDVAALEEALGENDDNWRPALVQLVVDRECPAHPRPDVPKLEEVPPTEESEDVAERLMKGTLEADSSDVPGLLRAASEELKEDPRIVFAAYKKNPDALNFAKSDKLKGDSDFIKAISEAVSVLQLLNTHGLIH